MASSKNESTSCEQNNVNKIIEGIESASILDEMSTCASCGTEGNSDVENGR